MIKTIVTPQNNTLYLSIPNNYIGREIEVFLYAKDELEVEKINSQKKPSDFFGTLSKEEGEEMKIYITQSRNEWDRNI